MNASTKKTAGQNQTGATGDESQRRNPNPSRPDGKAILAYHDRLLPGAEEAARRLISSWLVFGPKQANAFDTERLPGTLVDVAECVLDCMLNNGARSYADVVGIAAGEAPPELLSELSECSQAAPPLPTECAGIIERLNRFDQARKRDHLLGRIAQTIEAKGDPSELFAEVAALEAAHASPDIVGHSMVVFGVMDYPTESPPESILLGNGWIRRGDIATFISTAGAGKSVAVTQAAMAWGIGLPCLGISPARPLRILLFSGEDDGVTIGQCREGFLEHSQAITGRQLSAADLEPLDRMLRIEFCREHVGLRFHAHLAALLREEPADLVIVNPLLSYIGGEVVAEASTWLRAGLMPILQEHDCAALIAHHTPKLAKDGWDNTDDTYSAIGGAELANIPRAILTLRPTGADGLSVLKVSKRQTTGWKDARGSFTPCYFVKRTDNPERPAWLPVDSDEAADSIADSKPQGSGKGDRKATPAKVCEQLQTGAMQRQALIAAVMKSCNCSDRPARDAIRDAIADKLVVTFDERNPRGGNPIQWLCLEGQKNQWVK